MAEANGSSIGYKNVNKILGSFADEAFKNYESSTQEESFLSRNEWLNEKFDDFIEGVQSSIDEKGEYRLNDKVKLVDLDESAFYYTGDSWEEGVKHRMKFRDIKDAFFSDPQDKKSYKKLENISGSAKQHYGYYFKIFSDFKSTIKEGYVESKSTQVETKKYVLIVDEINRANLSSVLGELIYALEYRGQPVESIYSVEDSVLKSQIILSPNLYIIGTMNTADRSVGHIDYAIRRRFAFVDIFPKSLSEELGNDFKVAAFKTVAELFVKSYDESIDYSDISTNIERSEYLTHDFDPKDVWLGHSYFIQQYEKNAKGEDDKNKAIDFQLRIDYEIKPILEEYIKDGILKESARAVIEILEKTGANA